MIAKKPKSQKDLKADKFMQAGAATPAAANGTREFKPVLINFERNLLQRIDALALKMGMNRSAFIVNAVAERVLKLERGE
jgi:hypothetical protein